MTERHSFCRHPASSVEYPASDRCLNPTSRFLKEDPRIDLTRPQPLFLANSSMKPARTWTPSSGMAL